MNDLLSGNWRTVGDVARGISRHRGCSAMFSGCKRVGHRNCQTMSNPLEQKCMRSNDIDVYMIYDI